MTPHVQNNLAAERARRGWSQRRTGEAAGITRQSYAAIEASASVPSTEVALRLARAFGRSVEELFQLPDAPAKQVDAAWAAGTGQVSGAVGRRVRLTSIGGRTVAYPAGEADRASGPVDGTVSSIVDDGVRVELLPERPPPADLAVLGCDPAFGIVADALRSERDVRVAWGPAGSRASLESLARGEAHVVGSHLRDPTTGEANGPWIRELVPFPCTRVRFAEWEQAILVRSGNPDGIDGVADLVRPDVRFVNREVGSGSRMLLDEALESAGVPSSSIAGYGIEARSHLAVGEAIGTGLADAGIGIRAAAAAFGLDALPLRSEAYELVIPDHFLDHPAIEALLDVLRRPGIREQIEALQGYDCATIGLPAAASQSGG